MITLRETTRDDWELILQWRNNPEVYNGFYSQRGKIRLADHITWWEGRNKDWKSLIIEMDGDPIGEVRATQLDNWNPEVNIFIGQPELWGQDLGTKALRKLLLKLADWGYEYSHTTISDDNERAIKLFASLGFKRVCTAREEESRYEVKL